MNTRFIPFFLTAWLERRSTRRQSLRVLGGAGLVALAGCVRRPATSEPSNPEAQVPSSPPPTCIVRPAQTEGPFFVDQRLNRSDIRSDPDTGKLQAGVPLRLMFRVSQLDQTACVPLAGAIVDVWHCNAEGVYSDVGAPGSGTTGNGFLRGYQETAADGTAEFLTIYPGWYPGRTVHIHFKIRTTDRSGQPYEFTSQLYFEDTLTDQVHTQPPYRQRGARTVGNANDGIFARGGDALILPTITADTGYSGIFEIALQLT